MATMRRAVIDPEGFERLFRETIDPWNYESSGFEAFKRGILLRACGTRLYGRGLELACAIGETTRVLAPRCLRLVALDASPTALDEAVRRLDGRPNVTFRLARLPSGMPGGSYDLIVASEILYYLSPNDLRRLTGSMIRALAPGGRIVIVHHLCDFDDAAIRPRAAQSYAFHRLSARMRCVYSYQTRWFQAAAFVKGDGKVSVRAISGAAPRKRISTTSCRPKPAGR